MHNTELSLSTASPIKHETNTHLTQKQLRVQASKMLSDEEIQSIILCDVLDYIGLTEEYRKRSKEFCITYEIFQTYFQQNATYIFGSRAEGTFAPDVRTDMDSIICEETLPVIEDISEAVQNTISLLIVRETNTPAGYVKLQLVINGVPCTHIHWPKECDVNIPLDCLRIDSLGRIVLFDTPSYFEYGLRAKNKPATKLGPIDMVVCLRCKTWPLIAREWLCRRRLYGWPTKDFIQENASLGFFVVKKGHPFSSEKDLEWRISLSLQERNVMFNLSDVQYKCYLVLKTLNRYVIRLDCITSYHWKTCVLFVIEENDKSAWQKSLLCHSVKLCITKMLKWVNSGFCPNYFIPSDNLFDGKINDRRRLDLVIILKRLLDVGFRVDFELYKLFSDNPKIRMNNDWSQWLQTRRIKYENKLLQIENTIFLVAGSICNIYLLDYDYNISNKSIATFIKCLWERLYLIQRDNTVTEHTLEETKSALSLFIPFIYVSLASNISSMAIQYPNQQVRSFLLLGSLSRLIKGDLSARLKFISVLYAIGLYEDCQWFLEREDEYYIKNMSSVCTCNVTHLNLAQIYNTYINTSELCTCVSFLPSELPITPDAMKYEMFRYIGTGSQEDNKSSVVYKWKYRAVVDCNIYFFLLKYLIKRKLRRYQESDYARNSIAKLLLGTNIVHRDVACNLLTWTLCSDCLIPTALICLNLSWSMMSSYNPYFKGKEEMLQYQFNAAKLHALVLLYNTWFARKTSSVHFCFQCFYESQVKLLKCSRCKISTYCSKQCQSKNWIIHKAVCKIVRCYQSTCPV